MKMIAVRLLTRLACYAIIRQRLICPLVEWVVKGVDSASTKNPSPNKVAKDQHRGIQVSDNDSLILWRVNWVTN